MSRRAAAPRLGTQGLGIGVYQCSRSRLIPPCISGMVLLSVHIVPAGNLCSVPATDVCLCTLGHDSRAAAPVGKNHGFEDLGSENIWEPVVDLRAGLLPLSGLKWIGSGRLLNVIW